MDGTTKKVSVKDKSWMLLVLTALNRHPIIYVVYFDGKLKVLLYEILMDLFTKKVGKVSDKNYFEKNSSSKRKNNPAYLHIYFKGRKCHA